MLKVRVRTPSSGTVELSLEPTTELGLLRFMLEEQTQIPASEQALLTGFPPRPVLANPEDTLETLGIRSGDQLILQKAGSATAGQVLQGHSKGRYIPPCSPKGSFVRRVVPADNSCLFHAAAYVLETRSRTLGPSLRAKIAEVVAAHPTKYTEAFLGRPNRDYCKWIQEPDSWGGAIELSILSFIYCTEIVALDCQTTRMDIYGLGEDYTTRAFVLYTGKHYDPMAMCPFPGMSLESQDQVLFNVRDEVVMKRAKDFVQDEYKQTLRKGGT